jgi:hypothetical protein
VRCFEGDFEQRRRPVALDDTIEAAARAGAPTGRSRTLHCSYARQLARHGSCSLPCRWASRGEGGACRLQAREGNPEGNRVLAALMLVLLLEGGGYVQQAQKPEPGHRRPRQGRRHQGHRRQGPGAAMSRTPSLAGPVHDTQPHRSVRPALPALRSVGLDGAMLSELSEEAARVPFRGGPGQLSISRRAGCGCCCCWPEREVVGGRSKRADGPVIDTSWRGRRCGRGYLRYPFRRWTSVQRRRRGGRGRGVQTLPTPRPAAAHQQHLRHRSQNTRQAGCRVVPY